MTVSSYFIFKNLKENKEQEETFEQLIEIVENNNNDNRENEKKEILNLKSLYDINNDLVGWIKIENTSINYPIMQSKISNYYLRKDFYQNYSYWRNTIFSR